MIIHEDAPKAKSLFLYSRTNLDFGDETVPTAGPLLSLEDNAPDGNMNVNLGVPPEDQGGMRIGTILLGDAYDNHGIS